MGFFKWYGQKLSKSLEVAGEIRERRAEQAAIDAAPGGKNEIIGFERRPTATRMLLLGPIGGLLFKKRRTVRRKDLE